MSVRFIGNFDHTVDAKNRTTVPKRFLESITDITQRNHFVLTLGGRGCLNMFTEDVFNERIERLDEDWLLGDDSDDFKHNFFGRGDEVTLDGACRLNLSKFHREWAGIDKSVTFVGVGRHIEIWATDRWQERAETSLGRLTEAKPRLSPKGGSGAVGPASP